MPGPFETTPGDDDSIFADKYSRGGFNHPAGSGGQSPSGVYGGGGLGGAASSGFGSPDVRLAYSPLRRRLDQIPLSERAPAAPQWNMGGSIGFDPTPSTGPPSLGWGGSPAPVAPPPTPYDFSGQGSVGGVKGWQDRGMSQPLNSILGPGGGQSIMGPHQQRTILSRRPGSGLMPQPGGGPNTGMTVPTPGGGGGGPVAGRHRRTGNKYVDSWFDYQEGRADQHTIGNIIAGLISGALDPYLEGTPFGKTPSAGVMDATRRNATSTADALAQRGANMGALYGLDPSQRGAANLQNYLNTQGGISDATNGVLDQHAMARDQWIRDLLSGASNYNNDLGTMEHANIWQQRLQPDDPSWLDYAAGIGGQVGGAWLAPGGLWGGTRGV